MGTILTFSCRIGAFAEGVLLRGFLVAVVAAVLLVVSNTTMQAQTRTLKMYNTHTKKSITVVFKRGGRYVNQAKINKFLRDHRTGAVRKIDMRLLDIVYEIWRRAGAKQPVHVVSGYRSPKTNRRLRRRGGYVARNSLHMSGRAIDFKIPGVSGKKLRRLAMKMERGGVGYYRADFIHVDTGEVRAWPRMTRKQLLALFPKGKTLHLPRSGKPLPGYAAAKRRGKRAPTRLAIASRSTGSASRRGNDEFAARQERQRKLRQLQEKVRAEAAAKRAETKRALANTSETLAKNKQRALARQKRLEEERKQRIADRRRSEEEKRKAAQQRALVARKREAEAAEAAKKRAQQQQIAARQQAEQRRRERALLAEHKALKEATLASNKARRNLALNEQQPLTSQPAASAPARELLAALPHDRLRDGMRLRRDWDVQRRRAAENRARQRAEDERQAHAILLAMQEANQRRAEAARIASKHTQRNQALSDAPRPLPANISQPYQLRRRAFEPTSTTPRPRLAGTVTPSIRPGRLPPRDIGAPNNRGVASRPFVAARPSVIAGAYNRPVPPATIQRTGSRLATATQSERRIAWINGRPAPIPPADITGVDLESANLSSPITALIDRSIRNPDVRKALAAIDAQAGTHGPLGSQAAAAPHVSRHRHKPTPRQPGALIDRFLAGDTLNVPSSGSKAEARRFAALALGNQVTTTASISRSSATALPQALRRQQAFEPPRKIVRTDSQALAKPGTLATGHHKNQSRLIHSRIENRIGSMVDTTSATASSRHLLPPDQRNIATLIVPPTSVMMIAFEGTSIADRHKLSPMTHFTGSAVRPVRLLKSAQ